MMHQDHVEFSKHANNSVNSSMPQKRRLYLKPAWRVREHMAFLIRNLQFYIQVCEFTTIFLYIYWKKCCIEHRTSERKQGGKSCVVKVGLLKV